MILHKSPETGYWTDFKDGTLLRVHDIDECADHPCAIHNHPSHHALENAPLNWRTDRGILERICEHGVGHPDHDSASYLRSIGKAHENVHGCDFCCGPKRKAVA